MTFTGGAALQRYLLPRDGRPPYLERESSLRRPLHMSSDYLLDKNIFVFQINMEIADSFIVSSSRPTKAFLKNEDIALGKASPKIFPNVLMS